MYIFITNCHQLNLLLLWETHLDKKLHVWDVCEVAIGNSKYWEWKMVKWKNKLKFVHRLGKLYSNNNWWSEWSRSTWVYLECKLSETRKYKNAKYNFVYEKSTYCNTDCFWLHRMWIQKNWNMSGIGWK